MPEGWQVIASIAAGVLSVGVTWKLVDMLLFKIEKKVDRSEYEEHCRRIDGLLADGREQFQAIKKEMSAQNEVLHSICINMEHMRGTMARMADKMNVPIRRDEEEAR